MKLVGIHEPYLYSVQFDEQGMDEYNRVLNEWFNPVVTYEFLEENKTAYDGYWAQHFDSTREAAESVMDEAERVEEFMEELAENTRNGERPDFDSYFKPLNGVYSFDVNYLPMKGYGLYTPSMLRLYAVKVDSNLYVIADGGIKLGSKIQDSPGLKDHVLSKINVTKQFLSFYDIVTSDDMEERENE